MQNNIADTQNRTGTLDIHPVSSSHRLNQSNGLLQKTLLSFWLFELENGNITRVPADLVSKLQPFIFQIFLSGKSNFLKVCLI